MQFPLDIRLRGSLLDVARVEQPAKLPPHDVGIRVRLAAGLSTRDSVLRVGIVRKKKLFSIWMSDPPQDVLLSHLNVTSYYLVLFHIFITQVDIISYNLQLAVNCPFQ